MRAIGDFGERTTRLGASPRLFDWWEHWSRQRPAMALVGLWALAEATVWPILPDFLLIPLAIGNRRRFPGTLLAAICGMAVGGVALYLFAYYTPIQAMDLLNHLPTVRPDKPTAAHRYLAAHGVLAFLVQPWSGIPFKVWAIEAGTQRISPIAAIPLFIAGRSIRMILLTTATQLLSDRFYVVLRGRIVIATILYLIVFFVGWYVLLQ